MSENYVNLTVNPCKMCMPMGVVTALYGIKKCMTILHGSQGCSTYIRRHMATHYNEPIDIASTSLTEEGTVYGGESNLLKGLENLIRLYQPEVIGVATTCLAETIGEDIVRIIDVFYEKHPEYKHIMIIPVSSPGYGGTQYEGFICALNQVVRAVKMDTTPNQKINIITGNISPADTRYLKRVLNIFGIDAILLPDLSENLDGIKEESYSRIPSKGTSIEEIKEMAGARMTIEISPLIEGEDSPAEYLYRTYGVPYERVNPPIGLRDTDNFYRLLKKVSGYEMPNAYLEERGRYLDAMVDSHKYNGEGRAVVFGEPDFVFSVVRLCAENGIMPLICATGSYCKQLKVSISDEIKMVADRYFIDDYEILDDVDFKTIEESAVRLKANLMIGSSDARRIEEKLKIPLVRRGFPIHDRMGGQRLRMFGYEGSLQFLDEITNVILAKKETSFRKDLYKEYYHENSTIEIKEVVKQEADKQDVVKQEVVKQEVIKQEVEKQKEEIDRKVMTVGSIEEKTKTHPCFNCGASNNARMHLPIAPKCNISCNYCLRKFDCPNESRPGVTTKVLSPEEAFTKFVAVKSQVENLTVVGIAGPGDALANFENTKKTLELIREYDPDITFCLSTNGLMLPIFAEELVTLGVTHVTITINAIDPKIGAKIYSYVDYMGEHYTGESAATILLTNQLNGLQILASQGIVCKVNIVMLKGINDEHIPKVVKKVKELGAKITNIMQMIPVQGSAFESMPLVSNKEVMEMRKHCGQTMEQMYHCKQCRADAIGTLGNDISIELSSCGGGCKPSSKDADKTEKAVKVEKEAQKILKFAIASKGGMLIDQHFGHVTELYIYEYKNNEAIFKEKRGIDKFCAGNEACDDPEDKITQIMSSIADCDGVIAMRIGESPKKRLKEKGIDVFATYDRIEDAVKKAADQLTHQ